LQLRHRDHAALAIRQRRQRLMPPNPPQVWLSFNVHNTPKLNHTLVSPPWAAIAGMKKAAGPRTGGF